MIGNTPSSVRAFIMFFMFFLSEIFYRKSNPVINLIIALDFFVLKNPYNIENLGMWLSILGTYGIIQIYSKINFEENDKIKLYIKKNIYLSFCVQILIFPIIIYNFNKISFTFFISNLLISIVIAPIIFLGIFIMFFGNIFRVFRIVEQFLLDFVFSFTKFISKLPISKFLVKGFEFRYILLYYLILFLILKYPIKVKKFIKNNFRYICVFIIIIIFINNINLNNKLDIHFIDVGQGDSTLIKTNSGKNILIDGGEAEVNNYNQSENVLLPYLLNRNVKTIDYIIISHFDSDHASGLIYIMKNLNVKNVIIGKQFEKNQNYKNFVKVTKSKNIKIHVVEAGNRVNIEKNLYFDILWPDSENKISDNSINNNSLVCKLVYKNFSMLFTGDIEEKAEKEILQKYKNNLNLLNSTVLKVAHHGSKTSSSKDFLELVKPKLALIGVGENNKFGHPSRITLENLQNIGCKIYRTDKNGEISIQVNSNGKIWIDKMLD